MVFRYYFEFYNSEIMTQEYLQGEINVVLRNSVVFDYFVFYVRFVEQFCVKVDYQDSKVSLEQ